MNAWLILPIAWPLAAGALGLALSGSNTAQRLIAVIGAVGQLVAAVVLLLTVNAQGTQVLHMGSWPAPFGISLVADHFASFVLVAGSLAGCASVIFAALTVGRQRLTHGYFVLTNVLLAAVAGAFLTGDLFNLYVWFEVMLIASFVLLAMGPYPRQAAGATNYVALNLVASATFLVGAGVAYALTGTLNFADLALRLPLVESRPLVLILAALLIAAFASKAAAYPLSAWLPSSYHTPAPDVSALFAGLLTKVGVYALARSVTLFFPEDALVRNVVLGLAGLTMLVGVFGALAQFNMRRLLSFHIASQVGYMLMGLGLLTPLALAGTTFYMAQHMITKTALFLVAGVVERRTGTGYLKRLGGLYRTNLALTVVFALAALSLAGIPPFAGFVAKFTLVRAGTAVESWVIVGISIVVSLLTLMSMVKIWNEAFWKDRPEGEVEHDAARMHALPRSVPRWVVILPAGTLALASVAMGFAAGPLMEYAIAAGEELADRSVYIEAVLGEDAWADLETMTVEAMEASR
ncbi:MAG: Na+/H+ antiporter subunit D [Dehalococcoidia bacterium]|nr:Na+/H+ antiporter subunit D [Dehalococcoidia bacterium]